ncbi:MAG: hypothetical protein KKH72_10710 [Alphaproteobacteria bacterium]|nr:hypothetical protein [Alphaproteobacteria bacterium]
MSLSSPQVRNDIETVVETHGLAGAAREKLIRIVTGAMPGNRDLPLYGLARHVQRVARTRGGASLFDLLAPVAAGDGGEGLPRLSLAVLDFLATMADYGYFDAIAGGVALLATGEGEKSLSEAVSVFAASLHSYRVAHLPFENRRQAFSTIRSHFEAARPGSGLPEDGDAIAFWSMVASPEGWTTYAATLGALVDFVAAAETRESTATVSLDMLREKGFDPQSGAFDGDDGEEPDLTEAIDSLAAADLKLFKGPELDDLRRLAAALPALRRWRRSGSALLSFGPVQNVLVQLKRQSAGANRLAEAAGCAAAEDYRQKLEAFADIAHVCHDIALLYRRLGETGGQNAPGASIGDAKTEDRIARMLRRQSLASRTPGELRAAIGNVLPALAVVATRLKSCVSSLETWPADGRDAAFAADRKAFADTFGRLYCSAGNT